jgi:hypothetical protein
MARTCKIMLSPKHDLVPEVSCRQSCSILITEPIDREIVVSNVYKEEFPILTDDIVSVAEI